MSFFGNSSFGGIANGGDSGSPITSIPVSKIITTDQMQFISKTEKEQLQTLSIEIQDKVDKSQIGMPNGIAKLNEDGKVLDYEGNIVGAVDSEGEIEWLGFNESDNPTLDEDNPEWDNF